MFILYVRQVLPVLADCSDGVVIGVSFVTGLAFLVAVSIIGTRRIA